MNARAFIVVTRPGEGLGFRLAGAHVEEIPAGDEAERFAPIFAAPATGVIAVEEQVPVPEALLEGAARTGMPVIFPFSLPRRLGAGSTAESYVGLLIRRAIGYHVRLK